MENEREFIKHPSEHTDDGYSEEKLAVQFDQGQSSQQPQQRVNVVALHKKPKTVFQAQKKKEI